MKLSQTKLDLQGKTRKYAMINITENSKRAKQIKANLPRRIGKLFSIDQGTQSRSDPGIP